VRTSRDLPSSGSDSEAKVEGPYSAQQLGVNQRSSEEDPSRRRTGRAAVSFAADVLDSSEQQQRSYQSRSTVSKVLFEGKYDGQDQDQDQLLKVQEQQQYQQPGPSSSPTAHEVDTQQSAEFPGGAADADQADSHPWMLNMAHADQRRQPRAQQQSHSVDEPAPSSSTVRSDGASHSSRRGGDGLSRFGPVAKLLDENKLRTVLQSFGEYPGICIMHDLTRLCDPDVPCVYG